MRREFAESVQSLGGSVRQCKTCMRFFSGEGPVCSICSNPERDHSLLAVVANDADLGAMERSGTYRGLYFVLGGTLHLGSEQMNGLRIKQLLDSLASRKALEEIVLAFPANPEGDATSARVREEIATRVPLEGAPLLVTTLGRGLSTGSELEYADPETLRSALEGRR